MNPGEERAIQICNAIAECMTRAELSELEQIEVLSALVERLHVVQKHLATIHGPSDEELLNDE